MVIRDFIETDLGVFMNMSKDFYSSIDTDIPNNHLELTFIYSIKKNPFVRGLMFEIGDKPAGYSLLAFTYSNELGGLCLWIDEIYIVPEYQYKGYMSSFMEFLQIEYKNKVIVLCLEVHKSNTHALKVYRHLGFRESDNMFMNKFL